MHCLSKSSSISITSAQASSMTSFCIREVQAACKCQKVHSVGSLYEADNIWHGRLAHWCQYSLAMRKKASICKTLSEIALAFMWVFHFFNNALFLATIGVLRHSESRDSSSFTNLFKSLRARILCANFLKHGIIDRWWQWYVKKKHSVGNFTSFQESVESESDGKKKRFLISTTLLFSIS